MFPNYVATVFRIVFKHAFKIAASRQVLTRTKSEIVQHLIHSFSFNSLKRITPWRKSIAQELDPSILLTILGQWIFNLYI